LGKFADYMPNDTDHEVLWLHYSCHLIIAFGIGGMLCTVVFHDATLPFTILLFMGIVVFSYIYKALDSFGAIAKEAEDNLKESEEYFKNNDESGLSEANPEIIEGMAEEVVKARVDLWVAERHFADPKLTIKDALEQIGINEKVLDYYLEHHTDQRSYRLWMSYLRVEDAKRQLLLHPNHTLDTIANKCGYASSSTLVRAFKAQEKMPPLEWLRKNKTNI